MNTQTTATGNDPAANVNPNLAAQAAEGDSKPAGQAPAGQQAQGTEQDNNQNGIDYSDPEQTKSTIEALRKENAKHRTANKELSSKFDSVNSEFSKIKTGLETLFGGGESKLTPEQQVSQLTEATQALETKNALLELAFEHEVPKSEMKYFNFLIQEEVESLADGEELSEERIAQLAKEVKAKTANPNTSVGTGAGSTGGKPPEGNAGTSGELDLKAFQAMSVQEKSVLYSKDKATYEKLSALAIKKGELI